MTTRRWKFSAGGRLRVAIIAAVAAFFVSSAQAQQLLCFPESLSPYLKESHGEALRIQGITDAGMLMQIFVNDVSAAFTVVLVSSDGRNNCLLASGQAFMLLVENSDSKKKSKDRD
tara:strand:+ start:975 stop:1322 length:348 start_codon:yes stop_codon:yes gene_type:complete